VTSPRAAAGHRAIEAPARALLLVLFVLACGKSEECEIAEVDADPSTQAPLPREEAASFDFHGNNPMQREFVFVHDDGSYDYVERWNFGVPERDSLRALEPALPDVEWDDELQATFGRDWKVGCRMHVCQREGETCCHQHCEDGGAEGTAYEPPDQFACMNSSAGGDYDWFIAGLRDGGMTELVACN